MLFEVRLYPEATIEIEHRCLAHERKEHEVEWK